MEAILLVIHLILALAIIGVILLQPAEAGGGLVGGSASNLGAPRRSGDILTRTTAILAGCFFLTSILLAVIASREPAQVSILERVAEEQVATPVAADKVEAPAAIDNTADDAAADTGATPKAPVAE